jgi:hypothetical protein
MPLPSQASHQQCSWNTGEGRKHTNRDLSVMDRTMHCVPLCTGQVKDNVCNEMWL